MCDKQSTEYGTADCRGVKAGLEGVCGERSTEQHPLTEQLPGVGAVRGGSGGTLLPASMLSAASNPRLEQAATQSAACTCSRVVSTGPIRLSGSGRCLNSTSALRASSATN